MAAQAATIETLLGMKPKRSAATPLAPNDWVAVQFADRTTNPSYWRLLNLTSGAMRNVCGNDTLVRFTSSEAWCFSVNGRSLRAASEPLPHG